MVRKATLADFERVSDVFAEENRFDADLLPEMFRALEPIITSEWLKKVLANPDKTLFVAEKQDQIVGVQLLDIRTNPTDPIFKKYRYVYVDEIAVLKAHRRQGISQNLPI